ncbi:hypothetical protein F5Y16DRAFT_390127 [Xylariaceae sp. FL0255]|nr:hypothetical protein F5Y16DRAFT_390127 [Xylariaceae sp. FL0255]
MSFTLTPFLYQTRTILRLPSHRASLALARSLHATSPRSEDNSIPFEYDPGTSDSDSQPPNVRGTITPAERLVFERIFADIKARGLKPTATEDGPNPTPATQRSTMLIMQKAAFDSGQALPATITAPGLLAGAAKDRAKALLRFPPALRGAAQKALDTIESQAGAVSRPKISKDEIEFDSTLMQFQDEEGLDQAESEWTAPADTFSRTIEVEEKRHDERARIEGLITAATSDFELWDILEKEVFSMPARLGIAKAPESEENSMKKNSKKSNKTEVQNADESIDAEKNQSLSLYVHGPLYPAYLLLGLRRLDTAFAGPSPLVFSVLPRIKELGLESYVLGVSTPFFNELLDIYWTRRGDLAGVFELLEEMRHCGVYFDRQTQGIMHRIQEAIFGMASAQSRNEFGRALMYMPDYEHSQRTRMRYWAKAIMKSIGQRTRDIGYASPTL